MRIRPLCPGPFGSLPTPSPGSVLMYCPSTSPALALLVLMCSTERLASHCAPLQVGSILSLPPCPSCTRSSTRRPSAVPRTGAAQTSQSSSLGLPQLSLGPPTQSCLSQWEGLPYPSKALKVLIRGPMHLPLTSQTTSTPTSEPLLLFLDPRLCCDLPGAKHLSV